MKTSLKTVAIRCAFAGRIAVRTGKLAMGSTFAQQSLLSVLHRPWFDSIPGHLSGQAMYTLSSDTRLASIGAQPAMHDRSDWRFGSDSRTPGKPVTSVMNRQETLKAFERS
jgi:hypothetical protein